MKAWAVVRVFPDGAEALASAWGDPYEARHAAAVYERQFGLPGGGTVEVREVEVWPRGEVEAWRRDAVRLNELRLKAEAVEDGLAECAECPGGRCRDCEALEAPEIPAHAPSDFVERQREEREERKRRDRTLPAQAAEEERAERRAARRG